MYNIFKWKDKYKDSSFRDSLIKHHSFLGWFKREVLEYYFSKSTFDRTRIFGKYITTPNLFKFRMESPLRTWRKAKKYFRKPKMKVYFHTMASNRGFPFASSRYVAKILHVFSRDVWWKDKYNSPRHEESPLIWICLFKKFVLCIKYEITYTNEFGIQEDGDLYYWEYLLEYLYYSKNHSLKVYSAWSSDSKLYKYISKYGNAEDGTEDEYRPFPNVVPCVAMSLNNNGVKKLKEELGIK